MKLQLNTERARSLISAGRDVSHFVLWPEYLDVDSRPRVFIFYNNCKLQLVDIMLIRANYIKNEMNVSENLRISRSHETNVKH